MRGRRMNDKERKNIIEDAGQPPDIRTKFIQDDLEVLKNKYTSLSSFEQEFYESIKYQVGKGHSISQKQFNVLQAMAERYRSIRY